MVALSALVLAATAATLALAETSISVTPHDSYSSSVGVLGCKINTNRVAYWPASVDCDAICVKVTYGSRSVNLLRIDHSGGAHDISYDAWNYLQTGQSATVNPIGGGGVAMTYEDVDASECADLIHTDGAKLPLSASNSMDFVSSCLAQNNGNNYVAKNHVLYNICDAICSLGYDETCTLDLAVSNQPSCPHTLGLTNPLTTAPVYNIEYESGTAVEASTGDKVSATVALSGDSEVDDSSSSSDGSQDTSADSASSSQTTAAAATPTAAVATKAAAAAAAVVTTTSFFSSTAEAATAPTTSTTAAATTTTPAATATIAATVTTSAEALSSTLSGSPGIFVVTSESTSIATKPATTTTSTATPVIYSSSFYTTTKMTGVSTFSIATISASRASSVVVAATTSSTTGSARTSSSSSDSVTSAAKSLGGAGPRGAAAGVLVTIMWLLLV